MISVITLLYFLNVCFNKFYKLSEKLIHEYASQKTETITRLNDSNNLPVPSQKALCPDCLNQIKRSKKNHYTIRRAPGKISHLLTTSQSTDLIINFKPENKKSNRVAV